MKYSRSKTVSHQISVNNNCCLIEFNDLVVKDKDDISTCSIFDTDTLVLDLDCVEINIARSQHRPNNSSMDLCFITTDDINDLVQLVELRFNYTELKNVKRTKLIDKVNGSTNVMGNSMSISNEYIFVFNSSLIQQARRRFFLMNPVIPNNYTVCSIEDLKTRFF